MDEHGLAVSGQGYRGNVRLCSGEFMNNDSLSLEVTWSRTLQVWWSYAWRCVLLSMLLGIVLGAIGGFIVGILGRPQLGGIVGAVLGYLGWIPVSIVMLKVILKKKFKTFSIELVSSVV